MLVIILTAIGMAWGISLLAKSNDDTQKTKNLTEQIANLAEQNKVILERVQDCSAREGKCYQENQENIKQAIQALLDGIGGQFIPHRLRNEAENLCQMYIFAGTPSLGGRPVEEVIQLYKQCVLEKSGGTDPPPIPINPYVTTTTVRAR